ncbi:hypothetical protein LMG23994_05263 [Cupriavidus pinatubonensis]|uniref:Uncharacterized protein n=1 Tax=Cupriavidus pinatubonensis TaxID=248026 RepID=A0ABM8XU59_9BURK|nr:hypothetical protein LMG23994_05263 [Cupriavidus pinatubonensis]
MRWGKVQNYLSVRTEEQFFAAFLQSKIVTIVLQSACRRATSGNKFMQTDEHHGDGRIASEPFSP